MRIEGKSMMDKDNLDQKKKNNVLMLPFLGIYTTFKNIFLIIADIFLLAFHGIKFVFFDLWKNLFTKNKNLSSTNLSNVNVSNETNNSKASNRNDNWFTSYQNTKLEQKRIELINDLQNEGSIRSKEPIVFWYRARNKDGKLETGTINGYSKLDVNTFLLQESYTVYEIKTNKVIDFLYGDTSIFAAKLSNKDLLFWLTQLSTYIKSGIPLTEAVKILNNQMKKKKAYRKAFQSIVYELTLGESFSKALEKQGTMFPALLINMIKAAEATGELEETLSDMSNYYEELEKTRKQMISAITYPTIIMVFAIAVITFILMYVIPQFVQIYKESDAEINGLTLFIINLSDFLKVNIWIVGLVIVVIILIIYFCYTKIKAFRKNIQYVLMHMPVIGNIIIYNELTIFTKTFASLLANNVFITDSIDILSRITNNEIYKDIMNETIDNIVKGDKISTSFKDHWAIPDVAYYMLVTGESTGQLAEMMSRVSDYYSEMHRSLVTNLKSFIEPILITMLAFVVGIIILAVIVPMFGLMDQLE